MKKHVMRSLGVLLSVMLAAGAYAGQGQTGFGGVSGQASAEDLDIKSDTAVQPAPAPTVAPTKKDTPPTVSKKKSKRVAKSSQTQMKATTHTTSTTVTTTTPRRPAMSADSSVKSGSAVKRNQSAKVASKTTAKSATSTDRDMKPVSPQPVATAPMPPTIPLGASTVEGEVLRITGDSYIVKDVSGKNVRLHVDKDTKVSSNISTHDMVEVHASEVSSAKSPKTAWHADSIEKR
jgi:hypothetical protein